MRRAMLVTAMVAFGAARVEAQGTTVRVGGEIQVRYIAADAPRAGVDDQEFGFQVRRARLPVTGTFLGAANTFRIRPGYDRASGTVQLDDAWIQRRFGGGLSLTAGQFKPMFLREEFVSSFAQLAAERSYTADYFTLDYTQGVEAGLDNGQWRLFAALHDGSYGANTDFANDRVDGAATARLELRRGAGWGAWQDLSAGGHARGLLLGAAATFERGERSGGAQLPDVFKYTVDVSIKAGPLALLGAYTAQAWTAPDTAGGIPPELDGATQTGVVAQAGVFVVPDRFELFGRGEWLDLGGVYWRNSGETVQSGSRALAASDLALYTAGFNWYQRGSARFTFDVVYAPDDAVPVANSGAGVLRTDRGGQLTVRSQFQVRF